MAAKGALPIYSSSSYKTKRKQHRSPLLLHRAFIIPRFLVDLIVVTIMSAAPPRNRSPPALATKMGKLALAANDVTSSPPRPMQPLQPYSTSFTSRRKARLPWHKRILFKTLLANTRTTKRQSRTVILGSMVLLVISACLFRAARYKMTLEGPDNVTRRVSVNAIVSNYNDVGKRTLSHSTPEQTKSSNKENNINNKRPPLEFQAISNMAPTCREVEASEISYTLVTQASFNRVWMLKHHCIRWGLEYPVSVAVFVTPNDEASINASLYNGTTVRNTTMPMSNDTLAALIHEELTQGMGCNGDQLTVQVVKPEISTSSNEMLSDYPVNILRNLALSAVRTTHVAYLDVDFWPSSDLHEILDNDVLRHAFAQDPKAAMIIPAFSMKRQCVEQRDCVELNVPAMPLRRRQMLDTILAKKALQFDPTNAGGHGSTRYTAWINQRSTTLIPIECVKSNRYEPYLVFRYCQDLPPFQEQFTGYGKNKMTWMMQLRRSGWSFWQLGEAFCVHYPHLSSQARRAWKQQPRRLASAELPVAELHPIDRTETRRGINDAIYVEFKAWMSRNIPDQTRVPNCPDFVDQDRTLWIKPRPLATTTKVDDKRRPLSTTTANKSFLRKRLYPIVSRLIQKTR